MYEKQEKVDIESTFFVPLHAINKGKTKLEKIDEQDRQRETDCAEDD